MRAAILALAAISTAMLCAGEAQAAKRAHHKRPAAKVHVQRGPAHHMSALAAEAARQHRGRGTGAASLAANDVGMQTRFGAFSRSYKLDDVHRPAIRPDQDGAVGVSVRIRTH